jgi:DNA-binding response OmpR family regulator
MSGFIASRTIVNRVLVVEDDRDEAAFLKELLQQHGMHVQIAKDGGQAQAAFTMHPPDFVLLDLILPNVSGFEVCEQLKRLNDSVPVLVLSAIELDDARELARRVGADGYLAKPYDPEELLSQIRDISEELWSRAHPGAGVAVETEQVRFDCTACGKRLKVSGTYRGRTFVCPRCGQVLTVPQHE